MRPTQAPTKILVTGGSGFIGSWVIRKLLDRPYRVRASVRSSTKGEFLCALFEDSLEKFEYVIVPDIEADDAFDEALEGIHAVQHIASPLTGNPDELVGAAVNGTMSMLRSVARRGNDVQRVVVTSSAATLMEPKPYPCVYTEADWNLIAPKALESSDATPLQKYNASKTLAERAAWDFIKDKKFDLVTVLPTLVIGPVIHKVESREKLSYSLAQLYDGLSHEKTPGATFGNWVDVRDVAECHVLAMERDEAAGQRIIASAGAASWQLIYDAINTTTPTLRDIPRGLPGEIDEGKPRWTFKSEKVQKLGLQYKTLVESARDSVISMREHGW
ncbi:D-lactaldehyde dehydrogenase [Gautieria morchelliformis]|nr:D-lactaldehyde dehydrogenase [Gautieria morchelliformis]